MKCFVEKMSKEMRLWSTEFWLPPGVTWDNLDDFEMAGHQIAKGSDLTTVPLYAILLITIRIIFERLIGVPLAARIGVKVCSKS